MKSAWRAGKACAAASAPGWAVGRGGSFLRRFSACLACLNFGAWAAAFAAGFGAGLVGALAAAFEAAFGFTAARAGAGVMAADFLGFSTAAMAAAPRVRRFAGSGRSPTG